MHLRLRPARRLVAALTTTALASTLAVAVAPPAGAATITGVGAWVVENLGQPDVNSDVFFGSSCFVRDVIDAQRVGPTKANSGNVTIGGCVFGDDGSLQDTQVSFESTGVGTIAWCADPDGGGHRTASLVAGGTRCTMTGHSPDGQVNKIAVNSTGAGLQSVTFCVDPGGDGCAGETHVMKVDVAWTTSKSQGVVESLYQRLLGRTGVGDSGREHWAGLLDAGHMNLGQVARALATSDEGFQQRVNLLFFETLDRPVDGPGRKHWTPHLRSTNIEETRSALLASTESRSYTDWTPEGYVRRIYPRIVGRFADEPGVAYWGSQIRSGMALSAVAVQLHYSREGREFAVKRRYFCCLHRAPTGAEVDFWADRFGGAFDEAALEVAIQGSAEHANMFA